MMGDNFLTGYVAGIVVTLIILAAIYVYMSQPEKTETEPAEVQTFEEWLRGRPEYSEVLKALEDPEPVHADLKTDDSVSNDVSAEPAKEITRSRVSLTPKFPSRENEDDLVRH